MANSGRRRPAGRVWRASSEDPRHRSGQPAHRLRSRRGSRISLGGAGCGPHLATSRRRDGASPRPPRRRARGPARAAATRDRRHRVDLPRSQQPLPDRPGAGARCADGGSGTTRDPTFRVLSRRGQVGGDRQWSGDQAPGGANGVVAHRGFDDRASAGRGRCVGNCDLLFETALGGASEGVSSGPQVDENKRQTRYSGFLDRRFCAVLTCPPSVPGSAAACRCNRGVGGLFEPSGDVAGNSTVTRRVNNSVTGGVS